MQQTNDFHTPHAAKRDVGDGVQNFSIRELCEEFDVTPRALRFYESQGLLTPERDGQRRIYSLRDRARLFLVLRGKRFGFSLAEIRELLELYEVGDRQFTQLVSTWKAAQSKLSELESRRKELDDAIVELKSIIDNLGETKAAFESGAITKIERPVRGDLRRELGKLPSESDSDD